MARILIIHSPGERLLPCGAEMVRHLHLSQAMLDIADDLQGVDICELARKLAEMLLEQL